MCKLPWTVEHIWTYIPYHPFPCLPFRDHPLKLTLGASWSSWITSQGYDIATLGALELPQATVLEDAAQDFTRLWSLESGKSFASMWANEGEVWIISDQILFRMFDHFWSRWPKARNMSKANGFVASAAICIPKATSEDSSSIVTECHQYILNWS